jgi:hypothetical protein
VIAVVAGALRSHVGAADPRLTGVIPVSLRTDATRSDWGNLVGNLFVDLATDKPDPVDRLRAAHAALTGLRDHRDEFDLGVYPDAWDIYPLPRLGYALALRFARNPTFSTVVTSVRGPDGPLGIAGARLTGIHSVAPLTDDLGLAFAVWSFEDRLSFAITTAPELVPDVWGMAARLEPALAELKTAVLGGAV